MPSDPGGPAGPGNPCNDVHLNMYPLKTLTLQYPPLTQISAMNVQYVRNITFT